GRFGRARAETARPAFRPGRGASSGSAPAPSVPLSASLDAVFRPQLQCGRPRVNPDHTLGSFPETTTTACGTAGFGRVRVGIGRRVGNWRPGRRSGRGRTAGALKGTGVSPRTARRGPPARPKSEGHRLLPTRACLLLCLVLVAPHAAFATTPAKDAAERPIAADPGIH